jgi:hypothetical protein
MMIRLGSNPKLVKARVGLGMDEARCTTMLMNKAELLRRGAFPYAHVVFE